MTSTTDRALRPQGRVYTGPAGPPCAGSHYNPRMSPMSPDQFVTYVPDGSDRLLNVPPRQDAQRLQLRLCGLKHFAQVWRRQHPTPRSRPPASSDSCRVDRISARNVIWRPNNDRHATRVRLQSAAASGLNGGSMNTKPALVTDSRLRNPSSCLKQTAAFRGSPRSGDSLYWAATQVGGVSQYDLHVRGSR